MFNILKKKIFFKKIFFNVKLSYDIKKKIQNIINFFNSSNYCINFIFLKKIKFIKLKKKFKVKNCNNHNLVFNYFNSNILFKNFISDVFINNNIIKKKNFYIIIFHSLYHVFGFDHENKKNYNFMLSKYILFLNRNK
ncbi:hypothetical protein [Candidatus Vidania fulgoroideorum]